MSKKTKRLYALFALLILTGFGYLFVDHLPGQPNTIIEQQPSVAMATMYTGQDLHQFDIRSEVNDGYITIPLSIVLEKKIVAYEYQMETTIIPLLAFINSDGKLVTAIRFCEPCNSKTFSIEGLELACGNCETHWKQTNLEGVQGSCQKYPPAPVASTIDGGLIRIKESDVRNWKIRI